MWQNATIISIMDAFIQYTISILVGLVGGWTGALLFSWRFSRRCTSLEWAVGDLQQRASSFKGKEMAEKRWTKEKAFDAELAEFAGKGVALPRKRYDNDPLGE